VLAAAQRLTRGEDFRRVSRRGRRGSSGTLVVHLLAGGPAASSAGARAGFVVGRAVGPSVLRHLVQRRLRHLCRDRLAALPPGSELVVRALPGAAHASYPELAADLDRCLERALADRGRGPGTVS
jgi:ribonuclease P protein component